MHVHIRNNENEATSRTSGAEDEANERQKTISHCIKNEERYIYYTSTRTTSSTADRSPNVMLSLMRLTAKKEANKNEAALCHTSL
jgi:hypothetical protein